MTIKEMVVFLASAIKAKLPVLITGAPGIGKSDLVDQSAALAGADMILSHPAVSDPTDAKGLPWVVDGSATFLPFGELHRAINATRPTVWFLDDLGQATPAVQASFMQLLLARRVNGHAISDHVTFIAATNRRTDRAGVSGILEPVKSRFASIVELVPDVDSWCQWALDHDVPPELIAFLRFKPDLLCAFTASNDLVNSPVPRTWSHAAKILALGLPAGVQHAALAGAVGDAAATELLAFLRLYAQLPSIDAILLTPTTAPIPTAPASLYAVASALAYRANKGNFDRIAQYCQRLMTAHGEFAALCVRDCVRRQPEVTQTTAYVRLAVGDFGQLISGGNR
jgi:AAA domain (dynein-related subfamily)